MIDKKILTERLENVQNQLSENQIRVNKSLKDTTINVLVENLTVDKSQFFGRSDHVARTCRCVGAYKS